jgi:hypothetical protein
MKKGKGQDKRQQAEAGKANPWSSLPPRDYTTWGTTRYKKFTHHAFGAHKVFFVAGSMGNDFT